MKTWWTPQDIWDGRKRHGGLIGSIYVLTGADWARRLLARRQQRTTASPPNEGSS